MTRTKLRPEGNRVEIECGHHAGGDHLGGDAKSSGERGRTSSMVPTASAIRSGTSSTGRYAAVPTATPNATANPPRYGVAADCGLRGPGRSVHRKRVGQPRHERCRQQRHAHMQRRRRPRSCLARALIGQVRSEEQRCSSRVEFEALGFDESSVSVEPDRRVVRPPRRRHAPRASPSAWRPIERSRPRGHRHPGFGLPQRRQIERSSDSPSW